ncbi:hypothetical protein GJV85_04145 [Sulfurimonas aquatica]|uniref:Lipopolysaccharide heptosyltransferase family protein n=1 Tax=Sulfurimonas aquatica TaxID=2672570 RepID=A0A975AZF8_9BACT|nr:glycosyltransferase family 9 protein [Sulfurimonas aquatica]QSZ41328.1 hypothetical protein GJV85_04145 [Sulfurimonas aquatica]
MIEYKKNVNLQGIHKVGIIMFGLMGDVLMRTTVIDAVRDIYPDCEITAICDYNTKNILSGNKNVNQIIEFKRNHKSKFRKNINKIKSALRVRKERLDLLIDLYGGGSSPFITYMSSARYRLGYAHQKKRYAYNLLSDYIPYENATIDSFNKQLLAILKPISNSNFPLKPIFSISDEAKQNVNDYISTLKMDKDKVYTINLGSGGEEKLLSNELYFKAIDYIFNKYSFYPAIVQNPNQEYLQNSLINDFLIDSTIPYIKLKLLSIDEVAAFIKETRFIVTPDTGLMHLSFAIDSYVLSIFTYTNPKLVDIDNMKFIPVYEEFQDNILYKTQKIEFGMIQKKIDMLFKRLNSEK